MIPLRWHPVFLVVTLFSGLMFFSCVEEYWPDMGSEYGAVLVVEGSITNKPGPHIVNLSLSTNLERPEYRPLTGYNVNIQDDMGNTETLIEFQDGSYQSSEDGIEGIPGRKYRIRIVSPSGKTYESAWEKMHPPVGIDTVWAEYEMQEDLDYDHLLEGYRFKITTKPANMDTAYFFWKLTGTYQYHANHFIKYVYDGEMRQFPHFDSLYMCWRTYNVRDIFTYHTINMSEPLLSGYPLHYVTTEDKKLSIRYSLYTRQFSITREAHEYWKNLHEQNTNLDGLYTALPFQVRGNVSCTSDPEELVLGYFMVASMTDNRIFVNKPKNARFYYHTECNMYEGPIAHMLWRLRDHWPVYLAATYSEFGQGPALPIKQDCVNCTESGGTIITPDFWITTESWEKQEKD